MKKTLLAIAAGILSMVAVTAPVQAQALSGSDTHDAEARSVSTSPASALPILGRSPEERIMVMGEAEEIANRRSPPRPAREHQPSDVNTEYTYTEWVELSRRNGWDDPAATFQARRQSNYQMCRETVLFIFLWTDLEERYVALSPAIGEMFPRVLGLRKTIVNAARISVGTSLLTPIVATATSGGTYGAVTAPGAAGNIAQTGAHASQSLDNRDMMLINLGFTELSLEAHILNARGNVRYYEFMGDYCTEFLSGSRI